MNSLQRHLQLWLTLSLAILVGLFWILETQSIKNITEGFLVSRLEHDADNIFSAIATEPLIQLDDQRINSIYTQPASGHYYAIRFAEDKQLMSASIKQQALPFRTLEPGETQLTHIDGPFGQRVLLLTKGLQKGHTKLTLAVAEDLTILQTQRETFRHSFSILAMTGLLVLIAVQSFVIRRSIKKLDPVKNDIRRLGHGEISKLSEDVPAEILPVIKEFNHILKLLSQRLDRSRHALGNLAHALKGPLNLLNQYYDTSKNGLTKKQTQQASIQTERIRQLMEREFKRARLAGKAMSTQRFNPKKDLPDLIDTLNKVHQNKSLEILHQVSDDVPPFGDLEDMYELLGNLLDNACKWANSSITCQFSGTHIIKIVIEDDGTGLSPEELEQLTKRGVRLDETVEGHGLGLSIAKDIVTLYGGKISFSRSTLLGGLKVQVLIPLIEH